MTVVRFTKVENAQTKYTETPKHNEEKNIIKALQFV